MGSLMSGWSCPVHDPKKVKYMRNRSMTRVEIDAYWKSKKKQEEDDTIKSMSSPCSVSTTPSSSNTESSKMAFSRSASMPMEPTSSHDHHHLDDVPSLNKSHCWWMASKWAFLNEPPVLINEPTEKPRRRPYNYTPDYTYTTSSGLITSTKSHPRMLT